jgi:hypothetical protein
MVYSIKKETMMAAVFADDGRDSPQNLFSLSLMLGMLVGVDGKATVAQVRRGYTTSQAGWLGWAGLLVGLFLSVEHTL